MDELDRFFQEARRLKPRQIIPDENTEVFDDDVLQNTTTSTQPSTRHANLVLFNYCSSY